MREERPATNRSDVSPLQFSMRTLLLATAAVAVLVVVWQRVGAIWGSAIVWFLVLVAAHVAANAYGTRQTRQAHSELADVKRRRLSGTGQHVESLHGSSDAASPDVRQPVADASTHSAPITRLGICYGPASRVLLAVITLGSALGAIVGTFGLVFLTTADTSGILLGVISASVLGGFLGFTCGSFVLVMSRAFQEAVQEPNVVAACRRGETA